MDLNKLRRQHYCGQRLSRPKIDFLFEVISGLRHKLGIDEDQAAALRRDSKEDKEK
jgi:hypothetical protein